MSPIARRSGVRCLIASLLPVSVAAQGPTVVTGGGFQPGSQVLYTSNFAQVPIGNFPSGLKYVRGPMEVVLVDGVPMLRSSGPAEFIIPLSAPLPQDFTLEFELVARNSNCCTGEELAFEGSPTLNRSSGSAWVAWHHNGTGIIGGGYGYGTSTVSFSEELRGELLGQRGTIQVIMSGTQFKLYTNGRQIYNIPDLVFRRSNVLRVFLGGVNDAERAVYLARVRLATGAPMPVGVATNPPNPPSSPGAGAPGAPGVPTGTGSPGLKPPVPAPPQPQPPPPPPPPSTPVIRLPSVSPTAPPPRTGGASPLAPPGPATLSASVRTGWGTTLRWNEITGATGYQIDRSDPGSAFVMFAGVDAASNPPQGGYVSSEDVTVLPGSTYQYRVSAVFANGPASGYSPIGLYSAPNQIPQTSNLTATVGVLQLALFPDLSTRPGHAMTWNWTPIPGVLTYELGIDLYVIHPVTGLTMTDFTRVTIPANSSPSYTTPVEVGKNVQFCVSVIRAANKTGKVPYAVCQATVVP